MRIKFLLPGMAASLLLLSGCDVDDWGEIGHFSHDFHYSYPLKAGGRLSLETFNGSVEITPWDQDTVDISGATYSSTQEAANALRIEIDHTADAVSARAVQPTEHRNNQGARFVVKAPRGTILDRITSSNGGIRASDMNGPARLHTSNGSIHVDHLKGSLDLQTSNAAVELEEIDGDVVAHSSNGHIHVERLRGSLEATTNNSSIQADIEHSTHAVRLETSNGSIELTLPPGYADDVRAHTSNSSITVHLPAAFNARLAAHTSNSSINSDFEMTVQGQLDKNRLEGTIGTGGPLLDLSTSNGSIRILRM